MFVVAATLSACGDDDEPMTDDDSGAGQGAKVLSSTLVVDYANSDTPSTAQIVIGEDDIAGGFSNDFIIGTCAVEGDGESTSCINIFGASFDAGDSFDLSDFETNSVLELGLTLGDVNDNGIYYNIYTSGTFEVVSHERDDKVIEFKYNQVNLRTQTNPEGEFFFVVVNGNLRVRY